MRAAEIKSQQPMALPMLRPELRLLEGAAAHSGEPTWLIHDPLHNRFIQIDRAGYETLRHWRDCESAEQLIDRATASGRVRLDADDIRRFIGFLHHNELTAEAPRGGWRHFSSLDELGRHSAFAWLVHNYLFFRLPLLRPQPFLERTLPLARRLQSRAAQRILLILGLAGLYLVARQWDAYVGTFQYVFNWEGAALMALGLGFVKAAHELGHAYTAVHYGCRVHTMGLAFIVMAPLLYTDVTDSWRLKDRRQRLAIDSAGIRAELAIAAVALFVWPFMPDGPLRSMAFVLSAVSIASSLAINLNPFMRFDGYYLLSEMVGVENLQARAFAMGRWKLREWLFGLDAPPPETLPRMLAAFLVCYAWAIWIYRLFLFVGIALVVYHYFFKALGILLFAVEIIYFVARPVWNELRMWHKLRTSIIAAPRTPYTAALLLGLGILAVVPWSARVEIPAVVEGATLERIYPPRAARVARVHVSRGDHIVAGAPVVTLASPDLEQELDLTRTRLRLAQIQHARRGADAADREDSIVLESTITSLSVRITGLEKEREELTVRAPISGAIVEIDPLLHEGRWIGMKEQLATIVGDGGLIARGYVEDADRWRLAAGSSGVFIPESPQRRALPVTIDAVSVAGAAEIEIADLASTQAGRIAVTPDARRRLVPAAAQYLVRMSVASASQHAPELLLRGVVIAEGTRQSFASRLYRQALKVLVRESGA